MRDDTFRSAEAECSLWLVNPVELLGSDTHYCYIHAINLLLGALRNALNLDVQVAPQLLLQEFIRSGIQTAKYYCISNGDGNVVAYDKVVRDVIVRLDTNDWKVVVVPGNGTTADGLKRTECDPWRVPSALLLSMGTPNDAFAVFKKVLSDADGQDERKLIDVFEQRVETIIYPPQNNTAPEHDLGHDFALFVYTHNHVFTVVRCGNSFYTSDSKTFTWNELVNDCNNNDEVTMIVALSVST